MKGRNIIVNLPSPSNCSVSHYYNSQQSPTQVVSTATRSVKAHYRNSDPILQKILLNNSGIAQNLLVISVTL